MNRYISRNYTKTENTIDRQHTDRGRQFPFGKRPLPFLTGDATIWISRVDLHYRKF